MPTEVPAAPSPARRSGRAERVAGQKQHLKQLPWGQVERSYPPLTLISDDEVETIHLAALGLLEEIGMEVLNQEAVAIYRAAGALIDGDRVRIGRELVTRGAEDRAQGVHAPLPQP